MKYRFACPECGHGQESSFVRIGAQVSCPACEAVFSIEPGLLEGGGASGLGPAGARRGGAGEAGGDGDAGEDVLGGQEPDALVGLSGLSGLMHGAEGEAAEGSGVAGTFPGNTGARSGGRKPSARGSFRGSAEAGAGVDARTGSSLAEDDAEAAPAAAVAPVAAPPTRDALRRQRAQEKEKERAAEASRGRRLGWGLAAAAASLLAVATAGWWLSRGAEPAAVEASAGVGTPPAPPVVAPAAPATPRLLFARRVAPGAPEGRPGVEAVATVTPDPLGQTRRLDVVLSAEPDAAGDVLSGPMKLHLQADLPGDPAYAADVPAGSAVGGARAVTVALLPPVGGDADAWTATVAR